MHASRCSEIVLPGNGISGSCIPASQVFAVASEHPHIHPSRVTRSSFGSC